LSIYGQQLPKPLGGSNDTTLQFSWRLPGNRLAKPLHQALALISHPPNLWGKLPENAMNERKICFFHCSWPLMGRRWVEFRPISEGFEYRSTRLSLRQWPSNPAFADETIVRFRVRQVALWMMRITAFGCVPNFKAFRSE
jgi:hypothetical protein